VQERQKKLFACYFVGGGGRNLLCRSLQITKDMSSSSWLTIIQSATLPSELPASQYSDVINIVTRCRITAVGFV
jgi:hypothetical protein